MNRRKTLVLPPHQLEVVRQVKLAHDPEPHDIERREYPATARPLLVGHLALLTSGCVFGHDAPCRMTGKNVNLSSD